MATPIPLDTTGRPWWFDALVYQVYVRSFADADGDGIGDLDGLRSRLDHLHDLGVDAIWLNPCYPSPQRDHGYDVADYVDIEPDYGTLETFDALVAEARERGIRILMDLVPNHCSSDHAWFRAALDAEPGSPERARFWFRDGRPERGGDPHGAPPNNWLAAFGGSAWTRASGEDPQWYLGTFTPYQPDLNHTNADVRQMFRDVLEFWFDRGVDGMRVDAISPVGKHPDLPDQPPVPDGTPLAQVTWENPYLVYREEGHDVWRYFREAIDDYMDRHPGRDLMMVAEAYLHGQPDLVRLFVSPDQFHQAFAFDVLQAAWAEEALERAIVDGLGILDHGVPPAWTLNNHDVQRIVTRLGRDTAELPLDKDFHLFDGDWRSIDVPLGLRRARAAISLAMALPGSLYLYQGEELGLPEVLTIPADRRQDPAYHRTHGERIGRDGCRVPLPWTADPATSYGFSQRPADGSPVEEPWLPQPAWWGELALDEVTGVAGSTLELYREVIAARREHAVRQPCTAEIVDLGAGIVAVRRGDLVAATNVTRAPLPLDLDHPELTTAHPVFASEPTEMHTPGVIPPDSTIWFVA